MLSRPPAAMAASWKASTVTRSSAAKATWTAREGAPWKTQKSGLPDCPSPAAGLHDQLVTERGEGFLVEALAPLKVRHGDSHVIYHPLPPAATKDRTDTRRFKYPRGASRRKGAFPRTPLKRTSSFGEPTS